MPSQFKEDAYTFALAIVKHWLVFLSATIGSGLAAIIGRNYMIPGWAYWLCPLLGLVAASFLAFRDQRRLAEDANIQKNQQKQIFETELSELKKKLAKQLESAEQRATTFAGDAGKWASECDNLSASLEAVTKERDEWILKCNDRERMWHEAERELNPIKADYKQVLEALTSVGNVLETFKDRKGFWGEVLYNDRVKPALSLPSAIAILKGDKI